MDDLSKGSDGLDFIPDTEKYLKDHLKTLKDNNKLIESLLKQKDSEINNLKKDIKKLEEKHNLQLDSILRQVFSLTINAEWHFRLYDLLFKKESCSNKEIEEYCNLPNPTMLSRYLNNASVFVVKSGQKVTINADDYVKNYLKKFVQEKLNNLE